MADSIHMVLSTFRNSILTSIAQLEFQLRDVCSDISRQQSTDQVNVLKETITKSLEDINTRMASMELNIKTVMTEQPNKSSQDLLREELLSFKPSLYSRNILVSSKHNTPALNAAVAAANPPSFDLCDSDDELESSFDDAVSDDVEEVVQEIVENVVEGVVEDEPLRPIVLDGISYYIDSDNLLYHETEDGYEQVGSYDPKKDTVELLIMEEEEEEEEEKEEEEEEGIEVEEFVYKGKTYQRDSDNIVYLDGEEIGVWDGKRILRSVPV